MGHGLVKDAAAGETPLPVRMLPGMGVLLEGCQWNCNSVGLSGATVYELHRNGAAGLYLKHGIHEIAAGITDEMVRLRWLGQHISVPQVRHFECSHSEAWLLTTAIPGRTAQEWLEDYPDRRLEAVTEIARFLHKLHGLPIGECPFNSQLPLRLADAGRRLEAGLIDASDFDEERKGWTPGMIWDEMMALLPFEQSLAVTHGDFSLDNILLEDGCVTGCIDVSRAGIADRYQDLAILWNCLRDFDEALASHLFAAYGILEPDERKLRFHLCLDECF